LVERAPNRQRFAIRIGNGDENWECGGRRRNGSQTYSILKERKNRKEGE